jgi:hypothetical protein
MPLTSKAAAEPGWDAENRKNRAASQAGCGLAELHPTRTASEAPGRQKTNRATHTTLYVPLPGLGLSDGDLCYGRSCNLLHSVHKLLQTHFAGENCCRLFTNCCNLLQNAKSAGYVSRRVCGHSFRGGVVIRHYDALESTAAPQKSKHRTWSISRRERGTG